jgi:hypothetical protein
VAQVSAHIAGERGHRRKALGGMLLQRRADDGVDVPAEHATKPVG